jgi:hypothetical protein
MFMQQRGKSSIGVAVACLLALQGCSTLKPYQALPENLEDQAKIAGFDNVRAWGNKPSSILKKSAIDSIRQERAANHGHLPKESNMLALSGGGNDGAFGAGFLNGWSKAGTRPSFKLVTGISTGSLIAPFAFLGPAYDPQLKKAYTTISDKDIYTTHSYLEILLSLMMVKPITSAANTQPLQKLITELVDADLLDKIAIEHQKGRRLLIGTSQLNAERLVIWDMGAIATRRSPEALALFRKVMLASASLPGVFPPQFFEVEAQGKKFMEMHADGGVETQVMLYENALEPFSQFRKVLKGDERIRKLYIIRNLKVEPDWAYVKPAFQYISIHAIGTLTKTQGIGDLFRLYTYAARDNLEYNLASIPDSFTLKSKTPFDKEYMNKLYELGYQLALSNYQWQHHPPLYRP